MSEKIITVFGATGAQGGGLVRAIQADKAGGFRARAVTRNAKSEAAQQLAALGAEIFEGDIDDPASIAAAMRGAHGAFCVTFYWAHMDAERELREAKAMAAAAKAENVAHVIWSTLEDTRQHMSLDDPRMPTLHGKYKVPHCDVKGEADAFFDPARTTFLRTSFYWDNIINLGMNPQADGAGGYLFTLPMDDVKLPGIAAEDIGKIAYGIFKQGAPTLGKYIGAAGEHLTGAEMAAVMSDVLGVSVRHNAVSPDVYRSFGFPGADDLGNMFQFKRDFSQLYRGARDPAAARAFNSELQDFRTWASRNKARIPLA